MKKIIFASVFTLLLVNVFAQLQDSLFVYKSGISVQKFAFNQIDTITFKSELNIDSIFFYKVGVVAFKEDVSKIDSIFKGVIRSSVVDIDGNVYPTIRIGTQVWMAQNLRVKNFHDGIAIPLYRDSLPETAIPGMLFYNNDEGSYANPYGGLYNFHVVNTNRLCPAGWRVPSMNDFYILNTYLGGESVAGGKMKEVGLNHWNSPNVNATNSSGFNAVPAGRHVSSQNQFSGMGIYSTWWSSSIFDFGFTYVYSVSKDNEVSYAFGNPFVKEDALPVRCLKNVSKETIVPTITNFSDLIKTVGDPVIQLNAITNSNSPVLYSIIGGYGAEVSPTGVVTFKNSGLIMINAYVAPNGIYTSNSKTIILKIKSGITVTDINGHIYDATRIGTQVWMQQNLRATKYADGTVIPFVETSQQWSSLNGPGMSFYNNDSTAYGSTFGAVYNWKVVNSEKLCPTGWHVPTATEWFALSNYLGTTNGGGKIKDAGEFYKESIYWKSPNTRATNQSHFTAIAAGFRDIYANFTGVKEDAMFWSSTLQDAYYGDVTYYSMYYQEGIIRSANIRNVDQNGLSVRCMQNNDATPIQTTLINFENMSKNIDALPFKCSAYSNSGAPVTYTISSGTAATITSNGLVTIVGAGVVEIRAEVVAKGNYLSTSKTIILSISPNRYVVIDINQNIYPIVEIGNQIWMAKNLKVTKLNDGTNIAGNYWDSFTVPQMAWYDNNSSTANVDGALYNWLAVGTQKLCPVGWHVPTDVEWGELYSYLGGGDFAGEKLKLVGTDPNATNETGFNAMLSGYREFGNGQFYGIGSTSYFWSNTKDTYGTAKMRELQDATNFNQSVDFSEYSLSLKAGSSVRCMKNNDGTSKRLLTTINFDNIDKNEGDASFLLNALTNSDGLVSYSLISGTNVTVSGGGLVTILGVGTVQIKATIAQTNTYINLSKTITLNVKSNNVTDIDGNVYTTILIGSQTWMVENLKVERYNDGTPIAVVTDNTTWDALVTPAMCWYSNDKTTYNNPYGALYNGYVVQNDKLCPVGWGVPTSSEYGVLNYYLGNSIAGGKLKEAGNLHWIALNLTNTPSSGFMAMPAGARSPSFGFVNIGTFTRFWSSTPNSSIPSYQNVFDLNNNKTTIDSQLALRGGGYSVRCIKR